MSIITKDIANETARLMTSKKLKEIEVVQKELNDLAYKYAIKIIPADVMKCFKKNKAYFNTKSSFCFYGNGFNYDHIGFGQELPIGNNRINPPDEIAKPIRILLNKIQDLIKARNQLKTEIINALLNLRTYKKVETEFPEAFKILPKKNVCQALTVNIDSIRQKLKQ